MKKTLKKTNKGFTLIELLVVVAIIAILALIVLLALNPVEMARRSRDSRRLSDLGTIRRAIDLALADKQTFSGGTGGYVPIDINTGVGTFPGGLNLEKYLSVVAQDPSYDSTGSLQVIGGGCTAGSMDKADITYEFCSNGDTYVLRANLESLDNCEAVQNDGGQDDTMYELGTAPDLDCS